MIVGVFRGSPAEKGGLHSGDIVLSIDGTTRRARASTTASAASAASPARL
jgi:C-terminal processing protease CtpA/Prc